MYCKSLWIKASAKCINVNKQVTVINMILLYESEIQEQVSKLHVELAKTFEMLLQNKVWILQEIYSQTNIIKHKINHFINLTVKIYSDRICRKL